MFIGVNPVVSKNEVAWPVIKRFMNAQFLIDEKGLHHPSPMQALIVSYFTIAFATDSHTCPIQDQA
jgi:hypothetical protein